MIQVTIDGVARLIQGFEEAAAKVGTTTPVLENAGALLVKNFRANFPEEGRRLEDHTWQPLTAATIADRLRKGYPAGPILTRTGDLKLGFTYDLKPDVSVRVYNDVDYFAYHQLGMGHNPERRMIVFPQWLQQDVIALFTKFIHEAMAGM